MMDDSKKLEPPLFLDMPFEEALTRFARTKPEQVLPPPGRKAKKPKAKLRKSSPPFEKHNQIASDND